MVRYVKPEPTVIDAEVGGGDAGRSFDEQMINPARSLSPISGEVRDPLFEVRVSQAKSSDGMAPTGVSGPRLESFAVGTQGPTWNRFPDAVEVPSENGIVVRLSTVGVADLIDANLEVVSREERLVLLTRQVEEVLRGR